ncbi:transketolase C-terminal domain-containing protein, partial [Malonomonas rubra]|uniref:transketolase-like TK C-terminal-containing protein n=1 Tax=Malonomonas rubra TaxID=57040 RepID=UPI0026EFE610
SIRLAALMGLQTIYVLTHDSIGLGEDGPTHQPIEHLPSLRAIPNLTVIRPSDANETAEAWKAAIRNQSGPTALILSRQGWGAFNREGGASAAELHRGAYILKQESAELQVLLIASGSEVPLALAAAVELEKEGTSVRVVSMPSWELFELQDQAYRDQVLPRTCTNRIAIEAASPFGWERYVGSGGLIIGMSGFGASGPAEKLMEHFGFTVENVKKKVKALLG